MFSLTQYQLLITFCLLPSASKAASANFPHNPLPLGGACSDRWKISARKAWEASGGFDAALLELPPYLPHRVGWLRSTRSRTHQIFSLLIGHFPVNGLVLAVNGIVRGEKVVQVSKKLPTCHYYPLGGVSDVGRGYIRAVRSRCLLIEYSQDTSTSTSV